MADPRPRPTEVGDVVLVHFREKPASFARVEALRPHERPGWHYCDLLFLTLPPRPITWILRREQIDGEAFTMGGEPVRLERLPEPGAAHRAAEAEGDDSAAEQSGEEAPSRAPDARGPATRSEGSAKVVSLFPRGAGRPRERS